MRCRHVRHFIWVFTVCQTTAPIYQFPEWKGLNLFLYFPIFRHKLTMAKIARAKTLTSTSQLHVYIRSSSTDLQILDSTHLPYKDGAPNFRQHYEQLVSLLNTLPFGNFECFCHLHFFQVQLFPKYISEIPSDILFIFGKYSELSGTYRDTSVWNWLIYQYRLSRFALLHT